MELVKAAIRRAEYPSDVDVIENSLFYCTGDKEGEVWFQVFCNECVNKGFGSSDYCRPSENAISS